MQDTCMAIRSSYTLYPYGLVYRQWLSNQLSIRREPGDRIPHSVLPPAEMGTAHMELSMADTSINLEEGWKQHPVVTGGWHLEYVDPLAGFDISIVTGPPGSGLMGVIAPGKPTTYEVWLPGLSNPTGYLTLDEIRGVITYLREKYRNDAMYMD